MAELENLHTCLQMVIDIRSQTAEALKGTSEGIVAKHGPDSEGKEKKFLSELKLRLDNIASKIKELEQRANAHQALSPPLHLGHSVYLSLDTAVESIPIYNALVNSHKWLDKAHEFSGGAATLLSQNSLSRSYAKVTKSRRRTANTSHTVPPHALDNLIATAGRLFSDMTFKVTRPNGTQLNAIVHVTLERILTAVLVFKGLMIEWVVVRGYGEQLEHEDDAEKSVWTESDYLVFQRITDNANAAMLNFQSPIYPELAVKSFMTYLHSFVTLFTDKCRKCGYHLHNNIPPTWREFKTLEPYHEDCKP